MSEIDKELAREVGFRESLAGKSCRQLYVEQCHELDLPVNANALEHLSPIRDDFDSKDFDFSKNYLGPNGVMALFPILKINRKMVSLNLSGQGMNDAGLAQVVLAITRNVHLNIFDISNNPDITDGSSVILFNLLRENLTIGSLNTDGTRLQAAMRRRIDEIAFEHTNADEIFFRTSTFLDLKQLFITKLDYMGSGILTPLEICGLLEVQRVSVAVADRFAKLGFKRNQEMNCTTFMHSIHHDFHSVDFLLEHMARPDNTDQIIESNWSVFIEAAEARMCALRGLQQLRLTHKTVPFAEAVEIVDLARQAMISDWTIEADGVTEILPSLWLPIVTSRYYLAEKQCQDAIRMSWSMNGTVYVPPNLTRIMYENFYSGSQGAHEVEVGPIISVGCTTGTLRMEKVAVRQILHRNQLGESINFTFVEWFAMINENFQTVFYETLPKHVVARVNAFAQSKQQVVTPIEISRATIVRRIMQSANHGVFLYGFRKWYGYTVMRRASSGVIS